MLSISTSAAEEIVAELDLDSLATDPLDIPSQGTQSWPFRIAGFCSRMCARIFGICSTIFLLALLANVPILQLITFGYLLDSSGSAARGQSFRSQFSGIRKAMHLGGIMLGAWLLIWPARFVSGFWMDAMIIDPTSSQTIALKIAQWFITFATVAHVFAAIICGGKLRYFFWPLIAPFSLAIWLVRRSSITRKLLSITVGWISPKLVADICNAQPITDWFLPAIFLRRLFTENLFATSYDSVKNFLFELELPRYFMLGLKGLFGTLCWLAIPTLMLAGSTSDEPGLAGLCLFIGIVVSVPVFALLPFVQTHFATDGKLRRFFEPLQVMRLFSRAPMAHLFSLFLILLLALPLFLLKIEQVPAEFLWSLSLLFIAFGWPSRMIAGWAVGRAAKKEKPVRWWLRYPIQFFAAPVSLLFAVIFYLTRYISWNGTLSLLENHVFLLPAPFWLS
ncbi:hypothetical protein [Mariniblastus fucicola]|nr:hypothetical protein [Mariniblastus fucicola]